MQTTFLSFISFLRNWYDVVNIRTSECWPVRASEINTRSNEFARLISKRIKKYPRSGLFFRSNISETVEDIRVLFSLWPRAIVALPNGANDVSVVHIVSEIWSRQHQNFGMLTCTSERNQYPFEWIRTANKNKEIFAFWAVFPVKYLRNGRRYSSSVFTVAKGNSRATKRCKRRFCRSYRFWDMKSSTSELRNADLYERAKSIPVRMNSHG